MSQLVLITGFEDGTNIKQIKSYIKTTFPGYNEVWMDPYMAPRAVVLFDEKLNMKDLQKQISGGEISRYADAVKPTQSVFVKTYKSMEFGVVDKLKYLFTSRRRGGSPVTKVEQLCAEDDCYGISFQDWDAVLKACKHTWRVQEQTLTVTPYFECFKEPVKQQLQRLIELHNTTRQDETEKKGRVKQDSSSSAAWELNEASLKHFPPQLSHVSNTAEAVQHTVKSPLKIKLENQDLAASDLSTGQKKEKYTAKKHSLPHQERKADIKCARPVLEHPYILMLLHLLGFETVVQEQYSNVSVIIDESAWEIEIKGPISFLKMIQKLLNEEDELDQPPEFEDFFASVTVQQHLQAFIDSEGLSVDIVDTNNKPLMQVKDGKERNEPFHDFLSSLVITKECSLLPSELSQEHVKWIDFIRLFKSTNAHQYIFVQDRSVTLMSLAHMSQDIDKILNMINNTIFQLTTDASSGLNSGSSFPESESAFVPQENSPKIGSKSKKIIICPQHCVFLWILNVLNLNEAAKRRDSSLTVDIDENEEEIIIKGTSKTIKKLKSALMKEDKQFPFAEHEQELLSDASTQQILKSCFAKLECHIVLSNNFEMSVAKKSGDEVQIRTFLTSFIKFRECLHLPEKYQTSREWESLVESCKQSYPHYHLLTTNNKVYLMSVTLDKPLYELDSFVEKISRTISTLTPSVLTKESVDACSNLGDEDVTQNLQTSDADIKSRPKTVKMYCKNPLLPWILNILNLKDAGRDIGVHVAINETGEEICIKGPSRIVKDLRTILIAEDNEFPFTEHEHTLLSDESTQQILKSCFAKLECHIVLSNKCEMSVVNNHGEEAQLRTFLTSFIEFHECLHLPEKYQTSREWESLVESCKQSYPHYHLLTTNNKVYLMSVALDKPLHELESFVEKINGTILALTPSVLTTEELIGACSNRTLRDEDATQNLQTSGADKKSSHKEVKIYCKNPVLTWVLNILNLKDAVRNIGVHVAITDTDNEICIKGPSDIVKDLKTILMVEDNEMHIEGHQEEFLLDAQVQQYVVSCFNESEAHIVFGDNLDLCVEIVSGEKKPLRDFFKSFIQFKECSQMPQMLMSSREWKKLVKKYKDHEIIPNCTSSILQESEMIDDHEKCTVFVNCTVMVKDYFLRFLESEFRKNAFHEKNWDCQIEYVKNGIQLISTSQAIIENMKTKLEQTLSSFKTVHKIFTFPNLPIYFNNCGSLIDSLSNEHRCFIEIADHKDLHSLSLPADADMSLESLQRFEYKVILLGTAKCNGFNIHLVQGDIHDLHLEMKIELKINQTGEKCDIITHKSSQNVVILLPPWSVNSEAQNYRKKLRSSFQYVVSLALQQAECIKQTSIVFSTSHLSEQKDNPFPADVIASVILKNIFEKFDHAIQSKTLDIYICDPGNSAVFKAFTFFLKLRHVYIGAPDQVSWNDISFQDTYRIPDYGQLKFKGPVIDVLQSIPYAGSKVCVFYPIHPSLEISTCPLGKDSAKDLKSSLSDLQKQSPDGLMVGENFQLKGFHGGKSVFLYCSPDWGMDCDKAIERILKGCLMTSLEYEEVYIVPPGMQMSSKYPAPYLAQRLFRKLDSLIFNDQSLQQKKPIVLLVHEMVYQKAFGQELLKRLPKRNTKGFLQSLWNYWNGDKENTSQKGIHKSATKESYVPETVIEFYGTDNWRLDEAAKAFEKHLKNVMKKNTVKKSPNQEQMSKIKDLIKRKQEVPVLISYTKLDEKESDYQKAHAKNRNKKRNKSNTQEIKISGLDDTYLTEFMHMFGIDKYDTKLQDKNAQTKLSIPAKPKINKSSISENNSRQEQDSTVFENVTDDSPEHASVPSTSYKWLWEADSGDSFQDMEKNIVKEIETAYSTNIDFENVKGKFTKVNFTTMTVFINEAERGIIRVETLETPTSNFKSPENWSPMSDKKDKRFKLDKLEKEMDEFKYLQKELEDILKKNNRQIVEVRRVQNKNLYTHLNQKLSKMENKDHVMLWHRALSNSHEMLCKYGFHARFSGMPEAKHLGDGVLFYVKPDKCFNQSIPPEKEIHLIFSKVLPGKIGPGKQGLRCPSADVAGEPFDSVHEDDAYMIFSDAQAYPEYVLTLQ